jgi:hypothetical protein
LHPSLIKLQHCNYQFIKNVNSFRAVHKKHSILYHITPFYGNLNGPVAPNSYFSHGSKKGNTLHTRLRLQASSLNAHKVPIGLANSARCACGSEREDTSHYFLRCPLHCQARCDLFRALSHLLRQDFASLPALTQTKLLINGPQDKDVAMQVALAVQNFLFKTQRFH